MEELKENFERFFTKLSSYRQKASKNYDIDILKHIALQMINQCALKKGRIVVFGDKDPDGIFSSMIIKVYLERLMLIFQEKAFKAGEIGVDIRYSDREKDGFGLSRATYEELSQKYSLIITTDNGTSSDFHAFSIGDLIVIDHHPLDHGQTIPKVPYILNPNVWRTDGLEYSTSGGMVAYDVVRFMDKVLREHNAQYKNYLAVPDNYHSHEMMLEVLKEYAAFTLISDMAILDSNNRRFVIEALRTASLKTDLIPLYSFFEGEFSQRKFSFGIAPKINIDRMGKLNEVDPQTNLTYMENFIRPKYLKDFERAKKFILSVDKEKKAIVRSLIQETTKALDHHSKALLIHIDNPRARVGLGGLVANKLSQKYGKPAIVSIPTSDKSKLSFSARGHSVKSILSKIVDKAGGHNDACGGSVSIKDSADQSFLEVKRKLDALDINIPAKKDAVIHEINAPFTTKECFALLDTYQKISDRVETKEKLLVAVKTPDINAHTIYKSGWGVFLVGDRQNGKEVLFDSFEYPIEDIKDAEYLIFELCANGDLSLHKVHSDIDSYLDNTVTLPDAKNFNLASLSNDISSNTLPHVFVGDISHHFDRDAAVENVFYYNDRNRELLFDNIIDGGVIIVESYIEEKHPLSKREDVLPLYLGHNKERPLNANEMLNAYKSFAGFLLKRGKEGEAIFMPEGILSHDMISEAGKKILRLTLQSISNISNSNNKGQEDEKSISASHSISTD